MMPTLSQDSGAHTANAPTVCQVCLGDNAPCGCQRLPTMDGPQHGTGEPTDGAANQSSLPPTHRIPDRHADQGGAPPNRTQVAHDNSLSTALPPITSILDVEQQWARELDKEFQEFVETCILEHTELVQAVRATSDNGVQPRAKNDLTNWSSVKDMLALLAFAPDSTDPWKFLGVPREEGPFPRLDLLERRMQLGQRFASLCDATGWSQPDVAAAHAFAEQLRQAGQACITDLPRIQREKRKMRNRLVPRWLEPSAELCTFLHERTQQNNPSCRLALFLSNLQGVPLERFPRVTSTSDARLLYESVQASATGCASILQQFAGAGLMMWAPTEYSSITQLAATFHKFSLQPGASGSLQLLIPHDHYPGCETAAHIQHLWSHELMSPKWKNIVKQVEFLRQPTRCVLTGQIGPLHHMKSISIFSLSTSGEPCQSLTTQWRPTLATTGKFLALVIDCEKRKELTIHRALIGSRLRGLTGWEGPKRSLGNKGEDQRSTFIGYFNHPGVTDIDLQLYISILRRQPELQGVLIGPLNLFTEPGALLVEFGHTKALIDALEPVENIVLVSSRLALVTTPERSEHWCALLTRQLETDPLGAITKLRFRPSRHGGRAFAKPETLPSNIRQMKAKAASRPPAAADGTAHELQSTVRISEIPTGTPDDLLLYTIQQLGAAITVPFNQKTQQGPLNAYECRPTRDALGKWTGAIDFKCASQQELGRLYSKLQGSAIELNGTCCVLDITNSFLHLASSTASTSLMGVPTSEAPADVVPQTLGPPYLG